MQVAEGRHYFLEQPRGSDLLDMPIFQRLALFCAIWCYMDMCMVGLRSVQTGKLLKKPSELWASSEHLLWRFRLRKCYGLREHDTIEGGGEQTLTNLDLALRESFGRWHRRPSSF